MSVQLKCVEFVGGPLDGYQEVVDPQNISCNEMLRLTINENIIRAIGGERPGLKRRPSSIAYYERHLVGQECQYRHLGSTYPNDPENFEEWV